MMKTENWNVSKMFQFVLFDLFYKISNFEGGIAKGQTNLKRFFQADFSSKKRTNKLDFTTCRLGSFGFLEENEDTKTDISKSTDL